MEHCLKGVQQILPKDTAMQFLVRWYIAHNAPGSVNGQSEWNHFSRCLLTNMGFDVSKIFNENQVSQMNNVKKL